MKRIRRDRGTAISVWIKKYFPRLVSRYTNTLRICFMYCTNIRIKKKKKRCLCYASPRQKPLASPHPEGFANHAFLVRRRHGHYSAVFHLVRMRAHLHGGGGV